LFSSLMEVEDWNSPTFRPQEYSLTAGQFLNTNATNEQIPQIAPRLVESIREIRMFVLFVMKSIAPSTQAVNFVFLFLPLSCDDI